MKIKRIKKIDYKEDVYNLRIKSDDGLNHNYFANGINVSNCHKTKSTSIKNILGKCPAKRKFGLTGTFPNKNKKFLDYLTITAYTGPLVSKIKASKLQEGGYIADCEINQLRIKYSTDKTRNGLMRLKHSGYDGGKLLELEKDHARESEIRTEFIKDLTKNTQKNTLLLFFSTEYGKMIYNKLRKDLPNRTIFYIDGDVKEDIRKQYRKKMENSDKCIMVASYGTFSTGINIKNLHNIFLLESFKSETIIRQSIGRGLRNHISKGKLMVVDIVDDHRLPNRKFKNMLFTHGEKRVEIYKEEDFKYNIKNVDLRNKYKK